MSIIQTTDIDDEDEDGDWEKVSISTVMLRVYCGGGGNAMDGVMVMGTGVVEDGNAILHVLMATKTEYLK